MKKRKQATDWPKVSVLCITWDRPEEIRETLLALHKHLRYPRPVDLHIADDNSEAVCPKYLFDLLAWLRPFWLGEVHYSVTNRKGWGANANKGLRAITERGTQLVYQTEDDYVLGRNLDLREGVTILDEDEKVGMVRYRGITGHRLTGTLTEIKPVQGVRQGFGLPGSVSYWWLLPELSLELYVYSHGPHLKMVDRFHGEKGYGYYAVGRPLGATEEAFAHEVKDRPKSRVAILPDWCLMHYRHIGKSRQVGPADYQSSKESEDWTERKALKEAKEGFKKA
ncbi:MAG: glycosyltransferase [Gammaproteobacteria bacterium]|nr:glycosyltransferase [Gammaproteobacteria bacterium]